MRTGYSRPCRLYRGETWVLSFSGSQGYGSLSKVTSENLELTMLEWPKLGNLGCKIPARRLYAAFEQPNTCSARITDSSHTNN
jgi:hypothetical protein